MTLSLNVLNALLALSLIVLGTRLTNQSCQILSLLVTGLFLLIPCCSNISISCELGCLSNSGYLGLSGLNLNDCGSGGGGLVGFGGLVEGICLGAGIGLRGLGAGDGLGAGIGQRLS